ncbi:MAG: universal stress protein [Deltaproteobacteria bacterium]|nr:universal stress protein [Deltaproteobacteria bacterium]
MHRLKKVCVGTDFSPEAEHALSAASGLARIAGAQLDVVHVIHRPPLYERVLLKEQPLVADLEREALEHLKKVTAAPAFAGLSVGCHARVGTPFDQLLKFSQEQAHDLLVVGARKRSHLADILLGSTAERVLRKAPMPVLIAKAPLAAKPACILAPTDFSAASRPALDEALALARRWHARLVLLHVIEPIVQAYAWATDLAGGEIYVIEPEELQPEWDALLAGLDRSGVTVETQTIKGDVASTVAAAAKALPADLVILATHGRTGLAHALLGSVAEGVARAVEGSVLSVRTGAEPFEIAS